MRNTLVRGAAAVTGSVLALGLGLAAPSAQAATITGPAGADPAPAVAGAAYLAAQPGPSGIIKTYYEFPPGTFDSFDDYGVTIDAGFALEAVGGQSAKLATMTQALEDGIPNYVFGGGSAAKMSAFLLSRGRTGAPVNGVVATLESHIETAAPNAGRLVDADPNDFNTPLTQAYAANALNNAGSAKANSALSFLLQQQCAAGFFRASFSAKAAGNQTCDGSAGATGSVDTTGLAVLMLQDQKSKPAVAAAITKAADWLAGQQAPNGSFNSGNANSTGLAAWALGVTGRTTDAQEAALWLRGQQLANAGTCTKYAAKDNGAITLDALGLANAGTGPLGLVDNSVATRSTTQALPALLWAPGGDFAGATSVTGPTGFVRAGSQQTVVVSGAPRNTVCLGGTRLVLDASGKAVTQLTAPATTGKVTVTSVDAGGETDTLSFTALAAAKLTVKAKKTVAKGAKVVVKVTGLAPGETVEVSLGRKDGEATANAAGKAVVKLTATKVGRIKVTAKGAFPDRKGKATVTVKP
jgi:hypothetical protein